MNRLVISLMMVFLTGMLILTLIGSLIQAAASLANGVANAAASSALLASQCTSSFMIIVALAAGVSGGVLACRFISERKNRPAQPPSVVPASYPFVRVQSPKPFGYLPAGEQRLPAVYLPEGAQADETEVEDTLFSSWGW